ncbi:hypothetical protein AXF42_Ash000691 [Apostasia shenzhenica]|uniref:BSD domain-containing protein n=1 Tax=Apostasia shenzhenica TaxID=1088818 RepID=A0A2I0AH84_9ASPA|nr:hypothetical protein AXF42_Ash000691 [Apostasia shenzhenica]
MDFFKSVFSSDRDASRPSREADSTQRPDEDDEGEAAADDEMTSDGDADDKPNPKSSSPWVGLGGLIKTFAFKSESVIQTYRRDLEEFGSGLRKETTVIREVASRAVRDLPTSFEAGAAAAQESLESVGQAIDDFGGSVWRGTADIISHGRDALLAADSDADASSSDLQTPSAGVASSGSKRYSRFEVQVIALQSDPSTFSEEPEDAQDFSNWKSEFKLDEKVEDIETLCYDNGTLENLFEKLVPSIVDYETFWSRYFYKLHKLRQAEDVRASLVKRVISREDEDEDLTWEVDDDEEVEKNEEEAVKVGENVGKGDEEIKEGDEDIKEEDESKVNNKDVSKDEYLEAGKGKIAAGGIVEAAESVEEEKPVKEAEEMGSKLDDNIASSSIGDKQASNESTNNSDDKVPADAKSELVESCKDSDISIVSSQPSLPEEEDLGWDEIEDLGEHEDKKVGGSSSSPNKDDLRKRLSVAEDDEDLSWDIEDDDEPSKP